MVDGRLFWLQGPREPGKARDSGKVAERKRLLDGQDGGEERAAKRGKVVGTPARMEQRGNGGGASLEGRGKGGRAREKGDAELEWEKEKEKKSVVNIKKLKEELRCGKRALHHS